MPEDNSKELSLVTKDQKLIYPTHLEKRTYTFSF